MKQASAEIRALNKQLGIKDGRDVTGGAPANGDSDTGGADSGSSVLKLVQGKARKPA
jgi:hypothetical protein